MNGYEETPLSWLFSRFVLLQMFRQAQSSGFQGVCGELAEHNN